MPVNKVSATRYSDERVVEVSFEAAAFRDAHLAAAATALEIAGLKDAGDTLARIAARLEETVGPERDKEAATIIREEFATTEVREKAPVLLSSFRKALKVERARLASLDRQKRAAWKAQLLNRAAACEALGVTMAVFDWLVEAEHLPIAERVPFTKWGKHLVANRFDPADIAALSPRLQGVLDARLAETSKRRRASAAKPQKARSAPPSKAAPEAPSIAEPRPLNNANTEQLLDRHHAGSGLDDFPAFFPVARSMQRRFVFHSGPTNSGKTHAAMQDLIAAPDGCYAAPLRLMALENCELLQSRGISCALITGEEQVRHPGNTHTSSTIEMLDFGRAVSVAVIDEIQMLGDASRGWAWSAAVLGVPARTIYLTGSPDALPRIKALLAMTGESVEVRHFKRLSPLTVERYPLTLAKVEPGDAVIAFSRADVLGLRESLMSLGKSVAVIYGALGPNARRAEAERFRTGRANVLVATDAIGMGMNIGPLRRVIFSTLMKYDGTSERLLKPGEIRQIAGRAGRYGNHDRGLVNLLGAGNRDIIEEALTTPPPMPPDARPYVMPPWNAVAAIAGMTGDCRLRKALFTFGEIVRKRSPQFRVPDLSDSLSVAALLDGTSLPLEQRFRYLGCPVDCNSYSMMGTLRRWAEKHARGKAVNWEAQREVKRLKTSNELHEAENTVKIATLYAWLAMRWPDTYHSGAAAADTLHVLNAAITTALVQADLRRVCNECGKRLPARHRFSICDDCHRGGFE